MIKYQKNKDYLFWKLHQGIDVFHTLRHFGSVGRESACNARYPGLIPGLERSPGEGNGNPLQYSCLENLMDREEPGGLHSPWSHKELDTTE